MADSPERRADALPDGWHVEGLWKESTRTLSVNHFPTTRQLAQADAIIIKYEDDLGTDYRTIHGANDWDDLADLIALVIEPDSPVR